MTKAINDTADSCKLLNILLNLWAINIICMKSCVREWNTILIQVVANRNLSTERITTAIQIYLVIIVIISLYHHRNVKISFIDSIDNTNLVTEVRQTYQYAVNLLTICLKLLCHQQTIFQSLNGTASCHSCIFRKNYILVTTFIKNTKYLLANVLCQF